MKDHLKPISGFTLKMIALVTMLIDHMGATILYRMLVDGQYFGAGREQIYLLYQIARDIGRMAFPIYCFLLVEGFSHTHSRVKYAGRLFLFALISEIPFDMAFQRQVWDPSYQNVYFTLWLGLLTMWAMEKVGELLPAGSKGKGLLRFLLFLVLTAASMWVAEKLLISDYGMAGIGAIVVLYLLRNSRESGFALAVVDLGCASSPREFWALLMLLPIAAYDGSRGRQGNKYLFYAFYPAHLLVLALICRALGLA